MKSVSFYLNYCWFKSNLHWWQCEVKMSCDDYLIKRNSSSQQWKLVGNSILSFFFLFLYIQQRFWNNVTQAPCCGGWLFRWFGCSRKQFSILNFKCICPNAKKLLHHRTTTVYRYFWALHLLKTVPVYSLVSYYPRNG